MRTLPYVLFVGFIGALQLAWIGLLIGLMYYGFVFVKNEVKKQKVTPTMSQGVVQFRPCVWPNRCKNAA